MRKLACGATVDDLSRNFQAGFRGANEHPTRPATK